MPRIVLALSVVLSAVVGVAGYRMFGMTTDWTSATCIAISLLLAAGALGTMAAAVRQSARMHIAIAAGLCAAQVAIIGSRLAGFRVVDYDLFPNRKLAIGIGVSLVLAIYGLVRGRMWGRWLALALGATGAVSGGINCWHYWSVTSAVNADYPAWSMQMFMGAWVLWVGAIGGAMVVINLVAPAVGTAIAARTRDATWTAPSREARWIRATIVTALAAVPMLLVYAWLQPVVPATKTSAIVLAALLSAGAFTAIRGKLAGALLLVVAGAGLLAQTAFTASMATQKGVAAYYAVFWLPAAIVAIGCGVCLAGPVWRLVRR